MRKIEGVEPQVVLNLAIERLRENRRMFEKLADDLWPIIQDLGEFLEYYDEWAKEKEDKSDV